MKTDILELGQKCLLVKCKNCLFSSFRILSLILLVGSNSLRPLNCIAQEKMVSSVKPVENIIYPFDATAILDVSKPPYNADKTGKKDCTKILIRAYDDCMKPILDGYNETISLLNTYPDSMVSFESKKGRVIFPHNTPPSRIIYFPNGEYKVSNTIIYSLDKLQNSAGNEMSRQIHFQGQSQSGTIIKLQDNTPGFEPGANKPVISFMKGSQSNVAMSNTFENITINTGAGNPGATGLLFAASNNGAVRNVSILSGDPEKKGNTGLAITKGKPMGYFKNITIEGFDYGIYVRDFMLNTVFEHINLSSQKVAGFRVDENPVSIRKLTSKNAVPAIQLTGSKAHVVLIDCDLKGGNNSNPAIDFKAGFLLARDLHTDGYKCTIEKEGNEVVKEKNVREYSSHGIQSIFEKQKKQSLHLSIEELPEIKWEHDMKQWVSVNSFGGKGNGVNDDTKSIQDAMNSGKPVIYFNPGRYVVNGQITIPPHVKRINFMFVDLIAGESLKKMAGRGTFRITGNSIVPLIIEDLFAFEGFSGEQYFIDHASARTLILSDVHLQVAAAYFNSVPGAKVYIENVSDTKHNGNCFTFTGQKVWARQLNPERANPNVINDGSSLWILGFKTESNGVSFETRNGGSTEILGGIINNFSPLIPEGRPILINNQSNVSFTASTNGNSAEGHYYKVMVRETRNGITKELEWQDVPRRYENESIIPLYVGYK